MESTLTYTHIHTHIHTHGLQSLKIPLGIFQLFQKIGGHVVIKIYGLTTFFNNYGKKTYPG
jgi:hypothetical protein